MRVALNDVKGQGTCGTLSALVAALAVSVASLTAGKTPPDIPINLWFDNTVGQGLTADDMTAGASGVIADYIDGLQNVLAVIQGSENSSF